eukprot:64549_1
MEHSTNIKQLQNEIKSLKEQLRKYEHYNITDETVDDILDEIDAKEKQETKSNNALNWYEIKDKLRIQDIEYIKNLIVTNVLTVNEKDPMYGRTLLMYASMFGSYDIAELLCQIHADIDLTDNGNQSALDHALHFTNYHIVQLLQFTKLGASLGTYVKDKIETLNKQNGITRYSIKKLSKTNLKQLVKLLMEAIKDRAPFSDDMMHIAWQYLSTQKNAKPLQSPLFKLILETFEDIISNTRNKVDWCWLQEFLIPSTIWLLKKHPNDDTDETLLFDELLTRVHKETQKQYKIHLLKDINRIKEKNEGLWNELKAFEIDIPPNQSRQDQIPNGVKARYSKKELLHLKPLRSSFNPYTHYDLNQYLNELLLRAHIIDDDFQKDVQLMVNEIQSVNYEVSYRRGPVKLKSRCVSKIENDYHKEAFPTSAHLLDINRCSLTFDSLSSIMNGMKQLIDKINDGHTCLKSIIRYKNGFSANGQFDDQHPKYADVKLNVRIQSKADPHKEVIGEIQILLRSMMEFKRMKAHPLYSIERREEFVHNFKQIAPSMLNKQKQLFTFAINGDNKSILKFVVMEQLKPTTQLLAFVTKQNQTILSKICYFNHVNTFKLIEKLSEPKQFINALQMLEKSNSKLTPIGRAFTSNNFEIIMLICNKYPEYIMDHFLNPNNGFSALHYAVYTGNMTLLKWYLNELSRCDRDKMVKCVSLKSFKTKNALMYCVEHHHIDSVQYLLKWISDNIGKEFVITYLFEQNKLGQNAFIFAAKDGYVQCASILLSFIEDLNVRLKYMDQKDNQQMNAEDHARKHNQQDMLTSLHQLKNIQ